MAKKKFFVQFWDCPTCGEKKLNALQYKECPTCGQVLSDEFLTDLNYRGEVELDETDIQYQQALKGPDWLCPVCGRRNGGQYEFCNCGNSRDQISGAVGSVDSGTKTTGGIKDWMKDGSQLEINRLKENQSKTKKTWTTRLLLIGTGALILTGLLFLLLYRQDISVTLQKMHWVRSLDLQTWSRVSKSDWEDRLPSNARIVSRHRELFGYEEVKVGERTDIIQETRTRTVKVGTKTVVKDERRGNGVIEQVTVEEPVYKEETYTEEVPKVVILTEKRPIYKYKVDFTLDEWQLLRTMKNEGSDMNPLWPGSEYPASIAQPRLGDIQAVNRFSRYWAQFTDKESKTYSQDFSLNVWSNLKVGQSYEATTGLTGGISIKNFN